MEHWLPDPQSRSSWRCDWGEGGGQGRAGGLRGPMHSTRNVEKVHFRKKFCLLRYSESSQWYSVYTEYRWVIVL